MYVFALLDNVSRCKFVQIQTHRTTIYLQMLVVKAKKSYIILFPSNLEEENFFTCYRQ